MICSVRVSYFWRIASAATRRRHSYRGGNHPEGETQLAVEHLAEHEARKVHITGAFGWL